MNCPKCNIKLLKSYSQGIEVVNCPNCSGDWLEKGELNKMLERPDKLESQSNFNPYNNMSELKERDSVKFKNHSYLKLKKTKSKELFD